MRILLVEDDELLGGGVQDALRRARYATEWVRDGRAALAALSASDFDLVVLDLGLPGIDGLEVLRRLREGGEHDPGAGADRARRHGRAGARARCRRRRLSGQALRRGRAARARARAAAPRARRRGQRHRARAVAARSGRALGDLCRAPRGAAAPGIHAAAQAPAARGAGADPGPARGVDVRLGKQRREQLGRRARARAAQEAVPRGDPHRARRRLRDRSRAAGARRLGGQGQRPGAMRAQPRSAVSIRALLLAGTSAALLAVLGAAAWLSFDGSQEEAEELFDARLATSARVLEALAARQLERATVAAPIVIALPRALESVGHDVPGPLGHYYETKIAFQIRDARGVLLARSASAPQAPFAPLEPGFLTRAFDARDWRVFTLHSGEVWIQVAERDDVRSELSEKLAFAAAAPLLAGIPLLLVLLSLLIGYGLAPLSATGAPGRGAPAGLDGAAAGLAHAGGDRAPRRVAQRPARARARRARARAALHGRCGPRAAHAARRAQGPRAECRACGFACGARGVAAAHAAGHRAYGTPGRADARLQPRRGAGRRCAARAHRAAAAAQRSDRVRPGLGAGARRQARARRRAGGERARRAGRPAGAAEPRHQSARQCRALRPRRRGGAPRAAPRGRRRRAGRRRRGSGNSRGAARPRVRELLPHAGVPGRGQRPRAGDRQGDRRGAWRGRRDRGRSRGPRHARDGAVPRRLRRAPSDHAVCAQLRDLCARVTELAEDCVGVGAEHRGRAALDRLGARQRDRHAPYRRRPRQAGIVERLQHAERRDLRVVERLLRLEQGTAGNHRLAESFEHRVGRALRAPARHALADQRAVVAARAIVAKARIAQPLGLAHQPRPALVQRLADHLADHPAVARTEQVVRRRGLAAVAGRHAVDAEHALFDQQRVAERQRGSEQGAAHDLPRAARLALLERDQRAEGAVQRGAEVDPGHHCAVRLLGRAGHVDRARHHLADAVEADVAAHRTLGSVGRHRGEDDARIDRADARVAEPHALQGLARQVGDDDVGARQQTVDDRTTARRHRVEGERALVAVHLQEQGAFAALGDRRVPAVFAAVAFLDADHVGAVLGKQRGAVRSGDVTTEVEDANALQRQAHAGFLSRARARRRSSWFSSPPARTMSSRNGGIGVQCSVSPLASRCSAPFSRSSATGARAGTRAVSSHSSTGRPRLIALR